MKKLNSIASIFVIAFLMMAGMGNTFVLAQANNGNGNGNGNGNQEEAVDPNYEIEIDSTPVSGLTLSIDGTASGAPYTGNSNQQIVRIDWGDDSDETEADTEFEFTGEGNDKSFDGTWSAQHTYATAGAYTVTAYVCHQTCEGNDGEATDTAIVVIPPSITGTITVTKNVLGADGETNITDDQEFSVTVNGVTKPFGEDLIAEFTGLSLGSYPIEEVDIPDGYAFVSASVPTVSLSSTNLSVNVTITNKVETACNDGVDNDNDGETDLEDPGCSDENDNNETDPETPAQCDDDADNDQDGQTDFPNDPGCTSAEDNSETDVVVPPVTGGLVIVKNVVGADGQTEVSDATEFTVNAGALSATVKEGTNAEFYDVAAGSYAISEVAKAGYTLVSISAENAVVVPGATTTVTVTNKIKTACNDGVDNDEDGQTDLEDPGCENAGDTSESDPETPAQCDDDLDNDDDDLTDFPSDPGCTSVGDNDETDPEVPETGDLVIIKDVSGLEDSTVFTVSIGSATSSVSEGSNAVFYGLTPGAYSVSEIDMPEGYEFVSLSTESVNITAGATTTVTVTNRKTSPGENNTGGGSVCSDGLDNDNDGAIDFPVDDGCSDANDENETSHAGGTGGRRGDGGGGSQGQVLGAATSAAAESAASCGIYLDKFLRKDYPNDSAEVIKMQTFLASHLKINLPVTGYFGPMTEDAVKQFQLMYKDEILTPWGISQPTGIVFRTTARKINDLMCPTLDLPVPTNLIEWSNDPTVAR